MFSLEGTIYIVLYYLSASEFWPDDRSGLWWEGPSKRVIYFEGGQFTYRSTNVFDYLSASEFLLGNSGVLWWEGPYKRETIVSTVSYDWSYQEVMLMKNSYGNSSYSFRKPEATKIIF